MNPLFKKNYVLFVALMVLMAGIILLWFGKTRFNEFVNYHHSIAKGAVNGVATQITLFMEEKKRLVRLFADEHVDMIKAIAADPENDDLRMALGKVIKQYFPNYFAFTVADNQGTPYYEDFDGLVSEMCVNDMKSFASENEYLPHIHPNPAAYHFDVMTKFDDGKSRGILFISFHADVMGKILNSAQAPGHNVMLIYPKRSNLIEVVASGARNHIMRDDYRMSDAEQARILESNDVDETRWRAVDLQTENLFHDFKMGLIGESVLLFVLFGVVGGILVVRLAREEIHRQRAESKRDEAEANRNALISVIAHEFRTPVTAIVGSLNLLSESSRDMPADQQQHLMNMAKKNTLRLQSLINDFLDLQRLERQGLLLDKSPRDLVALVKHSIDQNMSYGSQFGVRYELKDAPQQVIVEVDEDRIGQVMANLLSNAAKYGASRQPVDIAITVQERWVRVSVRDYGAGIATEFQPRVFDKFATYKRPDIPSDAQTNIPQVPSTGLGLSICKAIIEGHGGTIAFDPTLEQGACFYFELPIAVL